MFVYECYKKIYKNNKKNSNEDMKHSVTICCNIVFWFDTYTRYLNAIQSCYIILNLICFKNRHFSKFLLCYGIIFIMKLRYFNVLKMFLSLVNFSKIRCFNKFLEVLPFLVKCFEIGPFLVKIFKIVYF